MRFTPWKLEVAKVTSYVFFPVCVVLLQNSDFVQEYMLRDSIKMFKQQDLKAKKYLEEAKAAHRKEMEKYWEDQIKK